jgi:acetyl esterase/lipase
MEQMTLWPGDRWAEACHLARCDAPGDRPSDRGVLVLPGGGYNMCAEHEGQPVAERLADSGLSAAVLQYRHGPKHRHPAPVHDVLRAVRVLRRHGWRYIALLGFSAGGHLAATAAVHHPRLVCDEDDLAPDVPAGPDALVLAYPVIDLVGAAAHTGSRASLLGPDPAPELLELLSLHRHVTDRTPPVFLFHTSDDPAVPLENSLLMAGACRSAGVPVELHSYESGPHGVGLAPQTPLASWFDHARAFLQRHLVERGPA